jgi:hypothetical protein
MARPKAKTNWRSTTNEHRKRKQRILVMSPESWEKLDEMAPSGTRSAFVEGLIIEAYEKRK